MKSVSLFPISIVAVICVNFSFAIQEQEVKTYTLTAQEKIELMETINVTSNKVPVETNQELDDPEIEAILQELEETIADMEENIDKSSEEVIIDATANTENLNLENSATVDAVEDNEELKEND